jgi:hypothetical protein
MQRALIENIQSAQLADGKEPGKGLFFIRVQAQCFAAKKLLPLALTPGKSALQLGAPGACADHCARARRRPRRARAADESAHGVRQRLCRPGSLPRQNTVCSTTARVHQRQLPRLSEHRTASSDSSCTLSATAAQLSRLEAETALESAFQLKTAAVPSLASMELSLRAALEAAGAAQARAAPASAAAGLLRRLLGRA